MLEATGKPPSVNPFDADIESCPFPPAPPPPPPVADMVAILLSPPLLLTSPTAPNLIELYPIAPPP